MTFRKAFHEAMDHTKEVERRLALLQKHGHDRAAAITIDTGFTTALNKVGDALADVIDNLPEDIRGEATFYIMRGVIANLDGLEDLMVKVAVQEATSMGIAVLIMNGDEGCNCPTCTAARAANATSYRTTH